MARTAGARTIAIVGGGIAGLAAGVWAQRLGLRSTVYEMHTAPGGVCTSWKRGPYLMDVGLRMVIGTAPPSPFHELMKDLGILPAVRFDPMTRLHCIEDASGARIDLARDPGALERNLRERAPQDFDAIRRFLDVALDFARFRPVVDIPVSGPGRAITGLRAATALRPVARHFARYHRVSVDRYFSRFRSPAIRSAFERIYAGQDYPVLALFASMGWFLAGQIGSPAAGPSAISGALESRYRAEGGDLRCGQRIERIVVESGRARGVVTSEGEEHPADIVLSAADGHSTLFGMLDGRHVGDRMRELYSRTPLFRPLLIIHYGLGTSLSGEPRSLWFELRRPMDVAGRQVRHLGIHHSGSSLLHAPEGHCVVRACLETEWEPWKRASTDPQAYRKAKALVADAVLERLDERFPGLAGEVKTSDVATPVTMERYTGNWRGSYEGWRPTTRTFGMSISPILPGLDGFYMAGQWVQPGGGIPGVIYSARRTIRILARDIGARLPDPA